MNTIAERLVDARKNAGFKSARAAATFLNIPYTTYYGYEKDTRKIDPNQADEFAKKFKVSFEWLLTGRGEMVTAPERQPVTGAAPIVGTVAAGMWQEIDAFSQEPEDFIPLMPGLKHPDDCYFVLRVQGKSMNRLFQDGALLMCLDIAKSGIRILDGDVAIVERRREQEGLLEVTAKRVKSVGQTLELWPESTEPKFQEPIIINGNGEDETIAIVARVVGTYTEM